MLQRKLDNLIKEKEEVIKENQGLQKQMEDLKSGTSALIQWHHFLSYLSRHFE
jgi:predicted nuclease with TOPRIM domain